MAMGISTKPLSSIVGRYLGLVGVIAYCFLLAGCSQPAPLTPPPASAFALSPGDKIRLQGYEHPEFSGDFIVDAGGVISVPKAGEVAVAGKPLRQPETEVAQQLARELNNPQVSITILEYRPIYVSGQVTQP